LIFNFFNQVLSKAKKLHFSGNRMNKYFYLLIILLVCSCNSESEKDILLKIKNLPFGFSNNNVRFLREGDLLITIPKDSGKKLPLLFVFGGLYYANPSFMSQQVPSTFFDKAIIVFAPCAQKGGLGYDFYMKRIRKILEKESVSIKKITVCGFSAGGPDALLAAGNDIKVIGLIDPNPVIPLKNKAQGQIITSFNVANWHNNSPSLKMSLQKQFSDYANWTKKMGGTVEENSVSHEIFPKYFFYKYRNRLI